jgi:hypothetical protein
MQHKIKVYDEKQLLPKKGVYRANSSDFVHPNDIQEIEVDAWCVAGNTGFIAFFYFDVYFCIAYGDDGYWHLEFICDPGWVREIKETVSYITERIK